MLGVFKIPLPAQDNAEKRCWSVMMTSRLGALSAPRKRAGAAADVHRKLRRVILGMLEGCLDRKLHLAKPLFPAEFFAACRAFLNECFLSFGGGWGSDAQLRTTVAGRMEVHPRPWDPSWAQHFSEEHADPDTVQELYKNVMKEFSASFGQLDFTPSDHLSVLPPDIRRDAMR